MVYSRVYCYHNSYDIYIGRMIFLIYFSRIPAAKVRYRIWGTDEGIIGDKINTFILSIFKIQKTLLWPIPEEGFN